MMVAQNKQQKAFLVYKYSNEPELKNIDSLKHISHFLFKSWVKSEKGGVFCTNQQAVNQQKKVFKHLLTQMGNNLLKNKSIMNISLPV